jgi:hypothetical protein
MGLNDDEITEYKYRFGQKYNLPESVLDEFNIPVFLAIEKLEEKVDNNITQGTNQFSSFAANVNEKLSKLKSVVLYSDKEVAYRANFARYALPTLVIGGVMVLMYGIYSFNKYREVKYENYDRLSEIVTIKDNQYFIPKENYRVDKKGIYLIEEVPQTEK